MGVVFRLDKEPTDCLHCPMRQVIHFIDGAYQQCKLDHTGYKSQSMFKSEDLVPGWKSPKCPLVKQTNEIIPAIRELMQSMYIDNEGNNVLNGGSEDYEKGYKYEIGVNYGLKKAINILKQRFPDEVNINVEAIIRGEEKI